MTPCAGGNGGQFKDQTIQCLLIVTDDYTMHTAQKSQYLFAYKYVVCINGPGVMSLHVSEVPGIEKTLVVVVREVLCSGEIIGQTNSA